MKKSRMIIAMFFIFLSFMSVPNRAWAGSASHIEYDWLDKLGRGAANFFTGFFEIPREINYTTQESSLGKGWTVGLVRGFGIGLMRMGAGAIETVTCPFDFPDEDKAPLMQPEFPWESERTVI